MRRSSLVFLLLLVSGGLAAPLAAGNLPKIPASTRVLSFEDVKNFWINTLRRKSVPPQPSRLQPSERNAWQRLVRKRGELILAVRRGDHDTQARLTQFKHNIAALRELGEEEKAMAVGEDLRKLEEHLARIETLKVQREAAKAQIDAAERLASIERKLSSLSSTCTHGCCPH